MLLTSALILLFIILLVRSKDMYIPMLYIAVVIYGVYVYKGTWNYLPQRL